MAPLTSLFFGAGGDADGIFGTVHGICRGCAAVRIAVRRRIGSAVRRTASREQTYDQSDDPSRRTKFACVHLVLALRSYCAKNHSAHPENISECAENMFCYVRLIIVRFYRTAILPSHFRHYFRFPLIPPFPLSSTDVAGAAYTWCGYLLRHNRNYAITGIATERWAHGQLQSQAGSRRSHRLRQ